MANTTVYETARNAALNTVLLKKSVCELIRPPTGSENVHMYMDTKVNFESADKSEEDDSEKVFVTLELNLSGKVENAEDKTSGEEVVKANCVLLGVYTLSAPARVEDREAVGGFLASQIFPLARKYLVENLAMMRVNALGAPWDIGLTRVTETEVTSSPPKKKAGSKRSR